MLFSWWTNRRRRQLLAPPFPPEWEAILRDRVGHYALLRDEGEGERDQARSHGVPSGPRERGRPVPSV